MAVFRCKMCGGSIEFEAGSTVGTCDSCGTVQTLPKIDDDRRASMQNAPKKNPWCIVLNHCLFANGE